MNKTTKMPKRVRVRSRSPSPDNILEELVTLETIVPLEKVRSCPDCDAVFLNKDELNAHRLTHDGVFKFFDVAMGMVTYDASVKLEQISILNCTRCTRGFTARTEYELHKLTHLKETFSKENQERPFECSHCNLTFAEKNGLEKHLLNHMPIPYFCFCGLGYRFVKTLQSHLNVVHKVKFQEPTGLTNLVFDSLVNEWQSFYSRNPKEKESAAENQSGCQNCSKHIWQTNGLSHLRLELESRLKGLIDTNKCEFCGVQYVQSPSLKVYKCYKCPKAFIGYQNVEKHEEEHKQKEKLDCILGEVSEEMDEWI